MRVGFKRQFRKRYAKLSPRVRTKFKARLAMWMERPLDPQLRTHPLKGRYTGYWSIDVTGDYRAVYRPVSEHEAVFVDIGTHSQLYK